MEQEIEVVKNKPNTFPCKGCADRHAGCHSECAAYLEARERNIAKRPKREKTLKKSMIIFALDFSQSLERRSGAELSRKIDADERKDENGR